ncbi:hypothetical protein ACHAPJ_013649, partial [Fusarium lateritium]
ASPRNKPPTMRASSQRHTACPSTPGFSAAPPSSRATWTDSTMSRSSPRMSAKPSSTSATTSGTDPRCS